jgi:hypothetical protein
MGNFCPGRSDIQTAFFTNDPGSCFLNLFQDQRNPAWCRNHALCIAVAADFWIVRERILNGTPQNLDALDVMDWPARVGAMR